MQEALSRTTTAMVGVGSGDQDCETRDFKKQKVEKDDRGESPSESNDKPHVKEVPPAGLETVVQRNPDNTCVEISFRPLPT